MSAVTVPKSDFRIFDKMKLSKEIQSKIKKIKIGQDFCKQLEQKEISYVWCIKHPEVLGCNESREYYQRYQEYLGEDYSICKHLLVHEKKGEKRVLLIIVDDHKTVDLKLLKEALACSKLEFVSNELLGQLLHTVPGNISLFNMQFDIENKVKLVMDQDLLEKTLLAFHPLYNGMSLFLTPDNIIKYLKMIGKDTLFMNIPEKIKEQVLEKVI